MSLSKEIPQTQEGLDFSFSFSVEQIQKLRDRAKKLREESLKAFDRAMSLRSEGLVRSLHLRMAGELKEAETLYLAFVDKLEQGHSIIIRPLERTEAQSEILSQAEWGKILEPEDYIWRRIADNPYLADSSVQSEGIDLPRIKGTVVKDLITSTFERPDLGKIETFFVSIGQALRAGITVKLKPQGTSSIAESK